MKISETALNQYKAINIMMDGMPEDEKALVKEDIKKITDYGFELMNVVTAKGNPESVDNSTCKEAMEALNALAKDKKMEPVFNTEDNMIFTQAINFINAVIIISSAKKQSDEDNKE